MRQLHALSGVLLALYVPACGSAPEPIVSQTSDLIEGVDPMELWQTRDVSLCFLVPDLTKMPADVRSVVKTQADLLARFHARGNEFLWAVGTTWQALGVMNFKAFEGCSANMVPISYLEDTATGGNAQMGRIGGLSYGIHMDAKFLANTYPSGSDSYHTFAAAHELGHVLGFRHEQDRPDSPCHNSQVLTGIGINLTDYDPDSIMNYCNAQKTSLSWFDQVGYRRAYQSLYLGGAACTDNNISCNAWAGAGECSKNPSYMLTSCCASCTSESPCNDSNLDCNGWAKSGECTKNPSYMLTNCCASCISPDPCTDHNPSCGTWAAAGECTKNPSYMLTSCCASCW